MECLHQAASHTISGCLSFSPIPLLLSKAPLPPLPVTLTHFALSSYKQALCLPTSFPILCLARLGMKPRLCRSSWRALSSIHPDRKEGDSQGAAVAHLEYLPPYDLVLWTDGSAPFPFGKGGSGVFANCSLCGTKATFSFSADPVCQVLLLKPAPFCKLFAGYSSTNKCVISLLFSSYLTLVLSSPPCFLLLIFLLPRSLWQIWQELSSISSCSIRLQWAPRHSFLPGNNELAK